MSQSGGKSGYTYASPGEAVAALVGMIESVGTERVALAECAGRVLAEEIRTDRPSPACDVSAMDGYALRVADAAHGTLPVAGEVRIGREPPELPAGAALKIVTGAPIPPGAEAVIKREDVVEHADRLEIDTEVARALRRGESIRRAGDNSGAGAAVLGPGIVLGPQHVAVLASVGAARPLVHARVRVGLLVTGDELLSVEQTPTTWQLRDSNGPALGSLLAPLAFADVSVRRHAEDDLEATVGVLRELASESDMLLVTGGVSMGDRDFVPAALQRLGARTVFHKLPQRPGKPILAALLPNGAPVLALPGNPVSVLVTARRIGVPVLRRRAGVGAPLDVPRMVTLQDAGEQRLDLWWHRAARLVAPDVAVPVPNMGSGDVMRVAGTDGFVEVPPGAGGPGPWAFLAWNA